jgi:hypothetical protein
VIKWFLSLLLLMFCVAFIDLCMLNHYYIPALKTTWSQLNDLSDMLLDSVCHYFIEDFASVLIKGIGL